MQDTHHDGLEWLSTVYSQGNENPYHEDDRGTSRDLSPAVACTMLYKGGAEQGDGGGGGGDRRSHWERNG